MAALLYMYISGVVDTTVAIHRRPPLAYLMIICIHSLSASGGEPCIFVDEDGCSHTFYVQANDILVEDDRGTMYIRVHCICTCAYIHCTCM